MNCKEFPNKRDTLPEDLNASICHRQTLGQRLANRRVTIVTKTMNESKTRLAKRREKRMDRGATHKSEHVDESMKVYLDVLQSTQIYNLGNQFSMLQFSGKVATDLVTVKKNVDSSSVATPMFSDTEEGPDYPELTTANSGAYFKNIESTSSTNRSMKDISDDDLNKNERKSVAKNSPGTNNKNWNV
ncbi:hypothetical protein CAEBREN_01217 [Caenorhabditis brenneri]|uniref:Uncharacterized protein n=1 Tax=Caenorhabditis brenneri TaxID=135651 RepID=G0MBF7_CAEBE|nr:hypothetical protein CAEBREN_01217 [Caenorhabditis brenneri]